MKRFAALGIALAAISLPLSSRGAQDPAQVLIDQAHAVYIRNHFAEAADLYQKAASDPSAPNTALQGLLRSSLWAARYSTASATVARLNERQLQHPIASNWLVKGWQLFTKEAVRQKAVDFTRDGKDRDAIECYRQILALEPDNRGILHDLEWVLWRAQHYPEAVEVASAAAALRPDEPEGWNVLGKTFIAINEREEALRAYRRSLSLDSHQPLVEQAIGKLYVDLRDFKTAILFLGNIQRMHPEIATTYPSLAKAQFYQGLYADSAHSWSKAVELFPDNVDYKIAEAQALYYSGHVPLALERLKKIAAETGNKQAVDFLTDDAIATGQLLKAETLLSEAPGDPTPQDPELMKLATLYKDLNRPKESIAVVNRDISNGPGNVSAVLFKGDYALQQGDYRQAKKAYLQAQRINPSAIRAWSGLAEARFIGGWPMGATLAIRHAERMDPTDPYLRLLEARYVYENGNASASARMLKDWLRHNSEPAVPVLLYHGLTPFARDPMLAYPTHIAVDRFDDHMKALRDAGFMPVTASDVAAWMEHKRDLPPHPVMVCFDDARADSFRYADPRLDQYGLKATMFVAIVNVEEHQAPAYAPWRQIEQAARSGRWEIQSHGDLAHERIQIDARGRTGYYLINRQWLEPENRLETPAQWRERVRLDYERSRQKIAERIGRTPVAYGFPVGTYGQLDVSNEPDSVAVNLAAVRRYFKTAYHQDTYGFNVRTRDPALMTRVEPHQDWTGELLIRHLRTQDPFSIIARQMTHQSIWEGQPRAARTWLADMRRRQFPEPVLTMEAARLSAQEGHLVEARSLSTRAVQAHDPDPDIPKAAESINRLSRPLWTPGIGIMADNRNRVNSIFHQEAVFQAGDSQWSVRHRSGTFHEITTIVDNALGAGWAHPLGEFNSLSLYGMQHFITGGAPDRWTASGSFHTIWPGDFSTDVEAGRDLIETQTAMSDGISEKMLQVQAGGDFGDRWKGQAQARGSAISDRNERKTGDAEVQLRLSDLLNLWAVYHFRYDDTLSVKPQYYSPQNDVENHLGLSYGQRGGRWSTTLKYLPGIGSEVGTGALFIQDLEADLGYLWSDDTRLSVAYYYSSSPTYYRNALTLEASHRF